MSVPDKLEPSSSKDNEILEMSCKNLHRMLFPSYDNWSDIFHHVIVINQEGYLYARTPSPFY